jgi:capsular exopolysaccharide synthesis family protein
MSLNVLIDAGSDEWNADQRSSPGRLYDPVPGGSPPTWDIKGFLKRRKLLILGVSMVAMAVATGAILALPKTYQATSAVIFQGDRAEVVRLGETQRDLPFGPDTLASEVELLTSEELLQSVVKKLNLVADPEFNVAAPRPQPTHPTLLDPAIAFLAPTFEPVTREAGRLLAMLRPKEPALSAADTARRELSSTVNAVRAKLAVYPVGVSRVIRIGFTSQRPEMAALVANTVASVYVDTLLDSKTQTTQEAHDWIDQRLNELRDRAAKSAQAYERFRFASGLARGKDSTITQEQITQVSTELTLARQRAAEAQSILDQTRGNGLADLDMLASVTGSQLLPRLREQLATATAQAAESEVRDGADNPRRIAVRARVADINRSIAQERERIRQTVQSRAAVTKSNEDRLAKTLDGLTARLGQSDGDLARSQALERDAAADRELYTSFINRARQTDPAVNYQAANARVLSRAAIPLQAASPNKKVLLPAALVLSLGLGAVVAFVKESSRRGLTSMGVVERTTGVTPIGLIPLVSRKNRIASRAFEDAVAFTLARVTIPSKGVAPRSLLVTSALPQEGKTKTSIALAAAATARGMRVLLVDGDLRSRSLSAAAGLDRSDRTLIEVLRREITIEEAIHDNAAWGFPVLPTGALATSPMGLLATGEWESILRRLEQMYDLVVIDSPPVLVAGDTWLMARHADTTVVLSRWGSTPLPTVELAINQLVTAQANVAGLVLTMVPPREHGTYSGGDAVMFSPQMTRYYDGNRRLS